MQVHFANVWEAITDEVGDRTALIHGDARVSWREHDEQAARLAQAFIELGLQPDSKVALYLYNGIEYVTAQYAAFKMRGVPVNVNYRYTDNELLYLLDNSDAEVLCFHTSLGDRVERVLAKATKLRAVIEVDDGGPHVDGALRWEDVLASHEPAPRVEGQPDDIYMLYTGGTTGMPKGVMYTPRRLPDCARRLRRGDHGCRGAADERRGAARARRPARRAAGVACSVPADARHRHVARHDGTAADEGHGRHADEPVVRRARAVAERSNGRA